MQASTAFWHAANFLAPAFGMALVLVALGRWAWRRSAEPKRFLRSWAWSGGAALAAEVSGLVLFGHDGEVATYALMVIASAVAFDRAGLRRPP